MSTIDTNTASASTPATRKSGRIQEFLLLTLSLAIVYLGWILVFQSTAPSTVLPQNFLPVAGGSAVFVFLAHLAVRWLAPWADPVLLPIAVTLNGLGLVMIHRIDLVLLETGKKAQVTTQFALSAVGIMLMLATLILLRDHRKLRKFTYLSLITGLGLLLLPMVPGLGFSIYGARLWINVAGFSFQPGEIAKICFVVFFAGYLVVQRDNLALAGPKVLGLQFPQWRHFAPILTAWIICLGILAMERDFGTALLFFGLFVAMLYVSTERVSWIVIGGVLSFVGGYGIMRAMPHIQARFDIWLHALDADVYTRQYGSFQLVQGWFGMASGGMFGTGLGEGQPTKSFAANSDFIMASFGEEIGLFGFVALLCLYLIVIFRALKTGIDLRDGFGKLLAAGFAAVLALQCFTVVGGVTRVIPLSGLAMPFLALGGSALLANWIIIGILMRMSDDARRPIRTASGSLSAITTGDLAALLPDAESVAADAKDDDANGSASEMEEIPSPGDAEADNQPTQVVRL